MTLTAILALTALTIGAGIIISLGLAKAITAFQEHQEEKAAKRQREADWAAGRAARWNAV